VPRSAPACGSPRSPIAPDPPRGARHNLSPLLGRTGWELTSFHDEDDRYLALAVRVPA
jgi:hypothetical protein